MFSLDSFTSQSQLTLTIGNWTGYPNSKLQAESRSTVGLLNPIPFRYPNPTWTSVWRKPLFCFRSTSETEFKFANAFSWYGNQHWNYISKGESCYQYWNNLALIWVIFSNIKGHSKTKFSAKFWIFILLSKIWVYFQGYKNLYHLKKW